MTDIFTSTAASAAALPTGAGAEAGAALEQAHRTLQILSRCNHAVLHAGREHDLIHDICRIAIDTGRYSTAWVGYAATDAARTLSIVAQAGDADLLACMRASSATWSTDVASPAGLALRSGNPVIVADPAGAPPWASWTAAQSACGIGSALYLPLKDETRPFGLFALFAQDTAPPDAETIAMLQELADNLAFGIKTIAQRQEQEQRQAAVSTIAASVAFASGELFFEQLAKAMAQAVGADGGVIARLLPADPEQARTVIAVIDGAKVADFDYIIADSPCKLGFEHEHFELPDALAQLFPAASAFIANARAYACWRLHASSGEVLGIAFVVFRTPIERSEFVASTLRIFAVRAAAELERQDADANQRAQASLLDKAQDGIIVRDLDDIVVFWNKSAERMYGWTREKALGRRIHDILGDEEGQSATAKKITLETGHWTGEITHYCKDGSQMVVASRFSLIKNDTGQPDALLSINTDISRRKAAEREIDRLAFYDPLTALPNRQLLRDRLEHALSVSARSGCVGALLFIDLDNFKTINDTLGHDLGDQMLQQVAQRLRACVYEIDTIARFGGDEFVVLAENLSKRRPDAAAQARHICEKIVRALGAPFDLDGRERHTTASIGVTLFNCLQCGEHELFRQAELAMYEVKSAGRNEVRFFDPEMHTMVTARAALEADLRYALQHDEFLLHYQPQIDRNGALSGAEALIRWQSPGRGLVAPGFFIKLAEQTGLILPMGQWVLQTACTQLARWATMPKLAGVSISVNVSARQLRQSGFVAQVLDAIERAGANARRLKIEITESVLVDDTETTIAMMQALKAHGVGFSLDDFGTGYSSLNYLKRLPLDQLKIDQSFVNDLMSDPNDAVIAQTILALGRCLHLNVIAEGVETVEQHDFLMAHGCDESQGYLFSRPVPVERFEQFSWQSGAGSEASATA